MNSKPFPAIDRRDFLRLAGMGTAGLGLRVRAEPPAIPGFEKQAADPKRSDGWQPLSDRKIRVGIAGYGFCRFGAQFGFQHHPNVEVLAVTDLIPDRCTELARECRCGKTYPSLEEMLGDDRIEAIFVATDAPSHARHCIAALERGKHVATAVPAVWGSLDDADALIAAVRKSGRKYMMFETSCFREDLFEMREIYRAGGFGQVVYAEGEYYHYHAEPLPSYKGWRDGIPPQWYPTHSNAYFIGVTGGHFTEVSCQGMRSALKFLQPENSRYRNPFGTEVALFRTNDGGSARMAVSWDTPGYDGEMGRIRGQRGSYYKAFVSREYKPGILRRPPLPPDVEAGGHGGSHGYLMNEFVMAILQDRQPLVNVAWALNMTVAGIVAHQSALKDGERMKVPVYAL